ncbi:MAG TPA: hypothetical protein VMT53_13040 [Terriglobales bacterium]|nr:hypothetical protein [Terriglobales bacterium]
MSKVKIVLLFLLLAFVVTIAWQIGSCEIANFEIRDDMHDLTSQLSSRIGLTQPPTDEELRNTIIRRAKRYGVELQPGQISVERSGSGEHASVRLSADYSVPIRMPGFALIFRFTPSSGR